MVVRDFFKTKDEPLGKVRITKIFINKRTGQMTILLPKRKLKGIPTRLEISYW